MKQGGGNQDGRSIIFDKYNIKGHPATAGGGGGGSKGSTTYQRQTRMGLWQWQQAYGKAKPQCVLQIHGHQDTNELGGGSQAAEGAMQG